MKRVLYSFIFFSLILLPFSSFSNNSETTNTASAAVVLQENGGHEVSSAHEEEISQDHGEAEDHLPPGWAVIPFAVLLLMIATGPLLYEHFWHHNYGKIAVALGVLVVLYYVFSLQNTHAPVHSFFEYVQFISLLTALFIASGGIMINVDKKNTPGVNVALLVVGAIIANIIGTTGASMLLIRPFIRVNKYRIKPYHIIFFIFMVSNIGGSLTPIGDPPLFLGFLKGVPFFWTVTHNFLPWVFGITMLAIIFYFIDKRNHVHDENMGEISDKVILKGSKSLIWLLLVILAVFIDPNMFEWVPGIPFHGQKFSFIREIIMLTVAYFSYRTANKDILRENEFDFEPIREVALLFIGIFATMMPALELVSAFAQSPEGMKLINHNTLFWGTGSLSGVLDNAPTYLNFLAAAMSSVGADINNVADVVKFAKNGFEDSALMLEAVSIGAVFFGAFTYIGNGPNFMVKSIAEQSGIKMPSFFGYIIKYSLTILLPLFLLTWLLFFAFVH